MDMEAIQSLNLAFDDLETAFAHRSDFELKKMYLIFSTINQPLVNSVGTQMASLALSLHLPFSETVIKSTVFEHFCGGTSIADCENTIQKLSQYKVGSILDYSVEGKGTEKSFEQTAAEILRTIDYSEGRDEIPFAVFKVTGIAPFGVLEKLHTGHKLTEKEAAAWERAKTRFHQIAERAHQKDVRLLVDAEETWIQNPIDELVYEAMRKYNTQKAILYNTFQHYTVLAAEKLFEAHALSQKEGFYLGAKLVRGAYMEKERARAKKLKYDSPIHETKEATDLAFNHVTQYCVEKGENIYLCSGTHNEYSNFFLATLMEKHGVANDDPRYFFAQLYGMSDHISYNLAKEGYRVAKYVPYGPVRAVMPYLIRRARENTSVKGQSSREFGLIQSEMQRREESKS